MYSYALTKLKENRIWGFIGLLVVFSLPVLLRNILPFQSNALTPMLAYTFSNWLVFVFIIVCLKKMKLGLNDIGFKPAFNLKNTGVAVSFFVIGLFLFIATNMLVNRLGLKIEVTEIKKCGIGNTWQVLSWIFLMVITAPICEETFFRGYAITFLTASTKSKWIASILSLVAFAVGHGPSSGGGFISVLPILLWGILPTVLFVWRKNLYPGIFMHMLHNAFLLVGILFSK